jgi:hypothetical protein
LRPETKHGTLDDASEIRPDFLNNESFSQNPVSFGKASDSAIIRACSRTRLARSFSAMDKLLENPLKPD